MSMRCLLLRMASLHRDREDVLGQIDFHYGRRSSSSHLGLSRRCAVAHPARGQLAR